MGLLHIPSADTDSVGTVKVNANFLPKAFLPEAFWLNNKRYNTFDYGFAITAFPWLEISYEMTLFYMYKNNDPTQSQGYYNQDRRVNVKFRPIKEQKWWPSIAVGMDDIGRFERFRDASMSNNYFQNVYGVISKHYDTKGNRVGIHLGYRYYPSSANKSRTGVLGGITYRPAFLQPLRFMAEYDGIGTNIGADVLLWRRLFVQVGVIHWEGFFGGLSYHYTIPF